MTLEWDHRYRRLEHRETIREGDEVLADSNLGWQPAFFTIGESVVATPAGSPETSADQSCSLSVFAISATAHGSGAAMCGTACPRSALCGPPTAKPSSTTETCQMNTAPNFVATVYLAGPITGCSYGGCTEWRDGVIAQLAERGIKGLSPMRAKAFLKPFNEISGTGDEYASLNVLASARGIMTRDFNDATKCDVLLVNFLGATRVSIGTVMEIAWAFQKRTPVVVVMEKSGNPHEHLMLAEATGYRVDTLEEALSTIEAIVCPDPVGMAEIAERKAA